MEDLATKRDQVKLRVVDIVSWDSAVARQYAIRSLPTVWLCEDGVLFARDRGKVISKLNSLR